MRTKGYILIDLDLLNINISMIRKKASVFSIINEKYSKNVIFGNIRNS